MRFRATSSWKKRACRSDGRSVRRTWIAVTLYAGQFAARSEKPVVITFAPVLAWWNVV